MSNRDDVKRAMSGAALTSDDVDRLEERLRNEPSDRDARLQCLGYLMGRSFRNPELAKRRSAHAIWFIEHEPGADFTGSPFCNVFPQDPAWPLAVAAWDRVLAKDDVAPEVIDAAASFFTIADKDKAKELLERGERVAPTWSSWATALGQNALRTVSVSRSAVAGRRERTISVDEEEALAKDALRHFERALALTTNEGERFHLLTSCAEAAAECRDWGRAIRFADDALALAPKITRDRHKPDVVHSAHIVRGLAALAQDDVTTSGAELLEAGRQGSAEAPVLRSFGPDFELARALLSRGERAVVIAYLDLCETFWKKEVVAKWKADIEAGGTPFLSKFMGLTDDLAKQEKPHE